MVKRISQKTLGLHFLRGVMLHRIQVSLLATSVIFSVTLFLGPSKFDLNGTPSLDFEPNTITTYFIPSEPSLDWSSPRRLAGTALRNYARVNLISGTRPLGHSIIRINCTSPGEKKKIDIWAAVTGGGDGSDLVEFLFHGTGANLLIKKFNGSMADPLRLQQDVSQRLKYGSVRFIKILLNEELCSEVVAYYFDFVEREGFRNFGSTFQPSQSDGVNCASFVLQFFDVVDLPFDASAFSRRLKVPLSLFSTEQDRVSFWELLFSKQSKKWSMVGEDYIRVDIIDPTLVYEWIGDFRADSTVFAEHEDIIQVNAMASLGLLINAGGLSRSDELDTIGRLLFP